MNTPEKCVHKMLINDCFSAWLGIKLLSVGKGYCKIQMTIRKEMLNGFNIVHGGILFAFADSAFAFSCNTYDNLTLALSCAISFPRSGYENDIIVAEAVELEKTNRTGLYDIVIQNQKNEILARFRGTAYRTGKRIIEP